MPWPYTKPEVIAALQSKLGFAQSNRDHEWFVLELDGRPAAYTYVSRGRRDRISEEIARKMARQMRLATLQEFRNAIDCPLSADEYHALIRERRDESTEEPSDTLRGPRQPLRWLYRWSGESFGYLQDDCLFTHDGRHVGKVVGDDIFAPDGAYIGEVRSYSGLITDTRKLGSAVDPYVREDSLAPIIPWAHRNSLPMPSADFQDFPRPEALGRE